MLYRIVNSDKCVNFIYGTAFTEKEIEKMIKADKEKTSTYTRQCLRDVLDHSVYGKVSSRIPFKCFGVRLISPDDFDLVNWSL